LEKKLNLNISNLRAMDRELRANGITPKVEYYNDPKFSPLDIKFNVDINESEVKEYMAKMLPQLHKDASEALVKWYFDSNNKFNDMKFRTKFLLDTINHLKKFENQEGCDSNSVDSALAETEREYKRDYDSDKYPHMSEYEGYERKYIYGKGPRW